MAELPCAEGKSGRGHRAERARKQGSAQYRAVRKKQVGTRSERSALDGTTRGGDTHVVDVAAGHEHGHGFR